MKPIATLIACMLLAWNILQAQDIHFSQIDVNPVLLNPAYSGFFDGQGRFGITYRNQWASVSSPFQTMTATAEVALKRRRYQQDGLSLGLMAFNDRAGTLGYGTTAANAILSYYKSLAVGVILSGAIEGGLGVSGFDPTDATLTDPSEQFSTHSVSYPLLGAGLALFIQPNDDFYLKLGASGRNLNQPSISFLGDPSIVLPRRYSIYARAEYRAWSDVAIMPLAFVQIQANNTETVVGADAKWFLAEGMNDITTFSAGAHYRMRDALYINATLEHNAWLINLSYDINLSKLIPASYTVGAIELTAIYRLNKQQKLRPKAMPCPII